MGTSIMLRDTAFTNLSQQQWRLEETVVVLFYLPMVQLSEFHVAAVTLKTRERDLILENSNRIRHL